MLPTAKRQKISFVEKEIENYDAESGFHSQVDFSCTTSSSSASLSRRKSCLPSFHGSYQQPSFSDSIGYGSASTSSILASPTKNRKRKSEVSETDENFYNSYQFVSPLKQRKRDPADKNYAKLILKEKCSSENVILSSTPIRTEQRANKWGKFRSFHPEKLQFGKSLDEPEVETAVTAPVKTSHESTLNFSSFNFSANASFNIDIPSENLQNLIDAEIKTEPKKIIKSPPNTPRIFFNGKTKLDILGKLHLTHDIIIDEILGYMDPESLLHISHVSKTYRDIVTTNKKYERKRKEYIKHHRSIIENKYPASVKQNSCLSAVKKKPFGNWNLNNHSQMILRQRPVTPPQSPQRIRQQITAKKCPRCNKPAAIKRIPLRNSPRKNRLKRKTDGSQSLHNISPNCTTGRISKRSKTFLSKTSIHNVSSFHEVSNSLTLPKVFNDDRRNSHSSSSCDSPCSSGSEDLLNDSNIETYEYADCSKCLLKFCIKCNCRYHPKFQCEDLSVSSPPRNLKPVTACSKKSLKSLKRLFQN